MTLWVEHLSEPEVLLLKVCPIRSCLYASGFFEYEG